MITESLRPGLVAICVLMAAATSQFAHAEEKPDRSKEQVRRLQQALRSAEQEKSQLAQDKAQLETAAKAAGDALEASKRSAATASHRSTVLNEELQATKKTLADLQQRFDTLTTREQDEAGRLQAASNDNLRLQGELKVSRAATQTCEQKNLTLYRYGRELLGRYENKGVWDALAASEPFTQLKRVEIENVLEEYRDKLDAQKLSSTAVNTKGIEAPRTP